MRAGAPAARFRGTASTLIAAVLLAGCATNTPQHSPFSAAANHWSGRLGVTVASDPPQQFSAGFDLTGDRDVGELSLTSPLGSTLAVLQWQPGQALLHQDGRTRPYASIDALTAAVTGVALPLDALFSWLHGNATPAQGWRVDLSQKARGRLTAHRYSPLPSAKLQIIVRQD